MLLGSIGVLSILLVIGLFVGHYKLLVFLKKPHTVKGVAMISFVILIFLTGPIGLLMVPINYYWLYQSKYNKIRKQEINYLVNTLSDSSVDRFINYIKTWGCDNKPDAWGELKGAWQIVNESPNISYEKKKEMRDCLMLNGLKLYNNEMKIMQNCR